MKKTAEATQRFFFWHTALLSIVHACPHIAGWGVRTPVLDELPDALVIFLRQTGCMVRVHFKRLGRLTKIKRRTGAGVLVGQPIQLGVCRRWGFLLTALKGKRHRDTQGKCRCRHANFQKLHNKGCFYRLKKQPKNVGEKIAGPFLVPCSRTFSTCRTGRAQPAQVYA